VSGGDDVLVVGAGAWGLMTAWRAARAGARVRVLDDGGPAATPIAAGMLGPWSEAEEGDEEGLRLMLRALAAWPATAAALEREGGGDAGLRRTGALLVAARPEQGPVVRRRLEMLAAWGERFAWEGGGALRAREPGLGTAVSGGAALPDEHQVEPRALLQALRAACASAGVAREPVGAAAVVGTRRARAVLGSDGRERRAGRIVVAAGAAGARLEPPVAIRPVKGQILRLRARPGEALPVALTVRSPSVYLAPRDGEVVVGATSEERGDRRVTAGAVHELLDEAVRVVPEIGELQLAETSAGLRPSSPDGRPVIGEDPATGLVWATGGHRHGILLAPIASEAAAAAALGESLPAWALPLSPRWAAACA
jgi:glycine oxidase